LAVLLGGSISVLIAGQKLLPPHNRVHRNPLLPVSMHITSFGMQSIMMGLVAELLMRTYYESQDKPIYIVREIVRPWESEKEANEVVTAKRKATLGMR
jgi:hypothetical protein